MENIILEDSALVTPGLERDFQFFWFAHLYELQGTDTGSLCLNRCSQSCSMLAYASSAPIPVQIRFSSSLILTDSMVV